MKAKVAHVMVNRAPVLTLWTAVVAERLGFDQEEALTLGRALAGLNAYAKGKALGLFHPRPAALKREREDLPEGRTLRVSLLHRAVPAVQTPEGLRAVSKGRPIPPETVERYLEAKFGDALPAVRDAMASLARSFRPDDLATQAFELYECFRPEIPGGKRGWGALGCLDLKRIRALARQPLGRQHRSR